MLDVLSLYWLEITMIVSTNECCCSIVLTVCWFLNLWSYHFFSRLLFHDRDLWNESWRHIGNLEKYTQYLYWINNRKILRDKAATLERGLESSWNSFQKLLDLPFSSVHLTQVTLPFFLYALSYFSKVPSTINYLQMVIFGDTTIRSIWKLIEGKYFLTS